MTVHRVRKIIIPFACKLRLVCHRKWFYFLLYHVVGLFIFFHVNMCSDFSNLDASETFLFDVSVLSSIRLTKLEFSGSYKMAQKS
jgi:hypothetical protein